MEGFFALGTDISERVRVEESLAESVANTALLRERQRIAADVHDLVVQGLFAASLQLDSLARELEPADAQRLTAIIGQIDEAMSTLRGSIKGLTRQIAPEQFLADIEQVLDKSAVGLGLAPVLTVDGPPSLIPPTVRPELLAVLQEALSNVTRHASATAVHVTITSLGPEVRLVVADNGCGIRDVERPSGLANVRSRAQRLGGFCSVANNSRRAPSSSGARHRSAPSVQPRARRCGNPQPEARDPRRREGPAGT